MVESKPKDDGKEDLLEYTRQAEHRIGELYDLCQRYRNALMTIKTTCCKECEAYWLAHDALDIEDDTTEGKE